MGAGWNITDKTWAILTFLYKLPINISIETHKPLHKCLIMALKFPTHHPGTGQAAGAGIFQLNIYTSITQGRAPVIRNDLVLINQKTFIDIQ